MTTKRILVAGLTAHILLAASCAVSPVEDSYRSQDRVINAWVRQNYPGLSTFSGTGSYVLSMEPGSGPSVGDSSYITVHYTKYDLDGTVLSTNRRELAEQTGSYSATANYGGNTWRLGQGYLPDDLETVLKTMRSGGRLKLALPVSSSDHSASLYSAFNGTEEGQNEIIEISIDTVVNNIVSYQEETIRNWFREHYHVADTAAEHLYFRKLEAHEEETDSISEGHTIQVRYIGRYLDGKVFDTNIEDSAKFHRIWDSGASYNALTISFYKDDDEQFESNNSVVSGFREAIQMMNYGEKAVTLFGYQLGYGESGRSPIPEYTPLLFWLYIEPRD